MPSHRKTTEKTQPTRAIEFTESRKEASIRLQQSSPYSYLWSESSEWVAVAIVIAFGSDSSTDIQLGGGGGEATKKLGGGGVGGEGENHKGTWAEIQADMDMRVHT